ncbi:putative codeine 3-O-demethylase [Rosa chinensis]|uniref:Putative codeine 3-O-demethylase n=1 Tax=Rosa chinensis TaxID=74649 RepID=A0A2P6Q9I8_ROSCH|nr:putative codeine 3-O-demethylase [Rosa chinensis]
MEKMKTEIQDFFNLPIEEKKRFWQHPGDVEGFGQAFVVSEEQKLDWADIFFLTTLPVQMRKPHLFPELPTPFKHLGDLLNGIGKPSHGYPTQMENALKIEAKELTKSFVGGMQSMRMNYYPPCPQPEKVTDLTPHSDAVGLTILLQVNELLEVLQVKKDGIWFPVKPLPDAFIVNVGDILEIQTNGTYRSIEHRAIVNSKKERLSIATFYSPRLDGEICPAPSLITEETHAAYTSIGVQDFFTALFVRKLQGKSFLDDLRL